MLQKSIDFPTNINLKKGGVTMRAKMEQYKVDVHVDGKSGYSTMVTASSTTEAKQLARLDVEGRNGFTNKKKYL